MTSTAQALKILPPDPQAHARPRFRMDGRKVLVIDNTFNPVAIVTWQRAFTMLFAGMAQAIENASARGPEVECYSADGAVVGVHRNIPVPAVIKVNTLVPRWRQRVRFCRKNVIVGRDRCVCQYCGQRFTTEELNLDHVVPRAQGGKTTWENIVASCVACNNMKRDRTPAEAGMKLLRKPVKPASIIEVSVRMDMREVPSEWQPYWEITLK